MQKKNVLCLREDDVHTSYPIGSEAGNGRGRGTRGTGGGQGGDGMAPISPCLFNLHNGLHVQANLPFSYVLYLKSYVLYLKSYILYFLNHVPFSLATGRFCCSQVLLLLLPPCLFLQPREYPVVFHL